MVNAVSRQIGAVRPGPVAGDVLFTIHVVSGYIDRAAGYVMGQGSGLVFCQ